MNQKKETVDDVKIPSRLKMDAYSIVYKFRSFLESFEVSENLGDWIDLIFGIYQKGEKALEKDNLFYYLTYEEAVSNSSFVNEMD